MKKTWFLLGVLLITLMLISCNRGSKQQSGAGQAGSDRIKVRIGWSPPDTIGVFKTATDFLEMSAADAKPHGFDIEVITRSAASHADTSGQVGAIENFIQNEVDAIVVSPADVDALVAVFKRANEVNIPIIMVNMLDEHPGFKVTSFIGFDNAQAASVSAYSMLDALGGPGVLGKGEKIDVPKSTDMDLKWWQNLYKDVPRDSISGNIAILDGVPGVIYTVERHRGFMDVISQFPNVKVMTTIAAHWERQPAVAASENILQNFPNIDGIFAMSAEMALGAAIAVKNAGLEGKVIIISNDGTPESVQAIRDGVIDAESWHGFPEWGWYATKFATMLVLGEEVPYMFDIRPRTEYAGNADNFYPKPALEPIDWAAIKAARKK